MNFNKDDTSERDIIESAKVRQNCLHLCFSYIYFLLLQKQKIVFALTSLELFDDGIITLIDELLQKGTMAHVFNEEDKNSVINTIRTSGDQEKARLTKPEAWNEFVRYAQLLLIFIVVIFVVVFVFFVIDIIRFLTRIYGNSTFFLSIFGIPPGIFHSCSHGYGFFSNPIKSQPFISLFIHSFIYLFTHSTNDRNVQENLHVLLSLSFADEKFQEISLRHPILVTSMQVIHMENWSQQQLVDVALYLLKGIFLQNTTLERIQTMNILLNFDFIP